MSPEYLEGNWWKLYEGERVTGWTSKGPHTLYGPQIIRVHCHPDLGEHGMMMIQRREANIEFDGLDFAALVEKITE